MSLKLRWKNGPESRVMQPPVSKSDALRLLFLRHARGEQLNSFPEPLPDDVSAAASALRLITSSRDEVIMKMGIGGAPFRFILALACMTPGLHCSIDAEESLRNRPHHPLVSALENQLVPAGLKLDSSAWPLKVDTTELELPEDLHFTLDPSSSQYLSALALAGAAAVGKGQCNSVLIRLNHPTTSPGYAELTARWIEQAGFSLKVTEKEWLISGYSPIPWKPKVPLDWSSAAYLLIWAWKCDGAVLWTGSRNHPDAGVIEILAGSGLQFHHKANMTIKVSGELNRGIHADAAKNPDLIPTLGVIALAAPGISRFDNVGILRDKESDRLQFLIDVAHSVGVTAILSGNKLILLPATDRSFGITISTAHDHRRAMAGSLLLPLGWPEVTIDNPYCVSKSFPGYWDTIAKCGVSLTEIA